MSVTCLHQTGVRGIAFLGLLLNAQKVEISYYIYAQKI